MKNVLYALSLFLFSSLSIVGQTYTSTGSMNTDRFSHETQLLYTGNVLAFGGDNFNGLNQIVYKSAQLYNPSTGTWSNTGSMNKLRTDFASVVLPNGNVMAIGGQQTMAVDPLSASCEIYNVQTGTWSYTDSMHVARTYHAAISLKNGQVLVVGGIQDNTCELYNPSTNKWTFTSSPSSVGYDGTSLVMLADGKILATLEHDAEIYNPDTQIWTLLPSKLIGDRQNHSSVLLNNGNVLITGGSNFGDQTTAELFNAGTRTFTATAEMTSNRASSKAILLDNGKVLAYGLGDFTNPANTKVFEMYDPATATWSTNQIFHTIGTQGYNINKLGNGKILISGGSYTTFNGATPACFLIDQNLTGCSLPITSIAATGQSICFGNTAVITLNTSENGIIYTVKSSNLNVAQTTGTGSSLTIPVASSSIQAGDNIFTVYANKLNCTAVSLADTAIIKAGITTTKPAITSSGNSICAGDSAKLSAPAGYSSYKWNTSAATPVIYVKNSSDYWVEVTSSTGCKSLPSDGIHISTNPILPVSISISTTKTTVISGDLVMFTPTTVNEGTNPVYTWKINNTASGNGSTFSTTALQDGDIVSCTLASNALCARPASLISNAITMKVTPFIDHPRVISTAPASNALNIANKQNITITFSKAMFLNANIDTLIRISGSYSGKIKGTYSGMGTNTIVFTPAQYTLPGEKVSIVIDSAASDVSGISMKYGYVSEFTVAAATAPAMLTRGTDIGIYRPLEVISADLNNDGLIDIIGVPATGGVQTKFNQGNGNFSSLVNLDASYSYIYSINATDFNTDGFVDICVSYLDVNIITIYTNDKHGGFTKLDIISPVSGDNISTGDFNGDGEVDIVLQNNYASSVKSIAILWNKNNGNFGLANTILNIAGNSYKTGDFDNDGDLDILVCNGNFTLLQNDGKGSFTNLIIPVLQKLYQYPEIIALGDFDKNGYLDPVVKYQTTFGIIKNMGNGTFASFDSIGNYPSSVIHSYPVADFDGDSNLDLIFSNFQIGIGDTLDIWKNNGSGKFSRYSRKPLPDVQQISSLSTADLDNDGDMDIATANLESSTISILLNDGTKTTIPHPSLGQNQLCTTLPVKIPLNKTGTFNTNNVFKLQLSDKNGSFSTPTEIGSASIDTAEYIIASISPTIPDGTGYRIRTISTNPALISNDNGFDITIRSDCNILKSVTPLTNAQNVAASAIVLATFTQEPLIPTSGINIYGSFSGSYLNKGTISKSGNALIFTPTNYLAGEKITVTLDSSIISTSGQQLTNPSTSTFTVGTKIAPALFTPYKPIDSTNNSSVLYLSSVGDLNNDGKIDVIAKDQLTSDINVYFNIGDGSFTDKKTIYPQVPASGTELFDFDNDGDLDIALQKGLSDILILQNDGKASFTLIQTISTRSEYFESGDINNDGFIDIVSITDNALLNIFLNDKHSNFNHLSTTQLYEYASSLSINDMDNDGDQDIVYGTTNNLWILNNINAGTTFHKRVISSGFWGQSLVVSDFNNDKFLDIAGNNKILFNDINNSFSISKTLDLGGTYGNLNAADFNGDNNMDLFFQTNNDYSTHIVLNDGTATFPLLRKVDNILFALPADIDNDGDMDLVGYTNFIGSSIRSFINDVSLTTQAVSSIKFCTENTINVRFVSRGIPGDILYTAQLSDANGSFTSPLIIGTGKMSPIICSIPATTPLGNGYRIRIVCDSVNFIGTDNGINLTITKDCPAVSSLSPAPNADTAEQNSSITATFTTNMLASSVNAGSFRVFKNYTGFDSDKGTFSLAAPKSIVFTSEQNYFAGEKISVTLTKQLQNTDQTPLPPFVYNFNIQPKASAGTFYMKDDVFTNYNQQQMGVKAGDLDNDGDLDLVTLYSYENKVSVRLNNQGHFSTKTDYICGQNPVDLSIIDIDSDGDADIITTNYSGEHISIFKNNGDATFSLTASSIKGSMPMNICSADFDGDGDMDFATLSGCSTNDGSGNFTETFKLPDFGYNVYINCIASADIDSDGDMDLMITTYGSIYSVITLVNNGEGNFTRKDQVSVPNIIYYIYTADFNNDGQMDFAACDGSSKYITLGTNTNGKFSIETIPTQQISYRLEVGDIDGDGDIDLLIPNVNPMGLSVLKNNGSASFTQSQFIDMGNLQPDRIIPADIDNDGDLDIVMTGANELRVLINGEASLATHSLTNASICGGETVTVPFTLYGSSSVTTFNAELSDASGSFANNTTIIGTGTTSPLNVIIPNSIAAGNTYRIRVVSADGSIIGTDNGTDIDLTQGCLKIASLMPDRNSTDIASVNSVVTNFTTDLMSSSIDEQSYRIYGSFTGFSSDKGTISLATPSSISFHSNRNFFPNEKVSVSLTTQLKSIGDVHLSSPFVYEFNVKPIASSGKFFFKISNYNTNESYNLGYSNVRLSRSGDFDNDGDLDVAMIQGGSGQLSIYLNTAQKLKNHTDLLCTVDPRRLETIDIDADGYLDLMTVNEYSISIFRNNGDGSFMPQTTFTLSDMPAGLAVADFNGDGNMDFTTCAFPTGISVNTNAGNTIFNEQVVTLTETDDVIDVASIDIDADGDMDIIAYSSDPNNLYAFENDGHGVFSYKNKICKLDNSVGMQIADLNNDNKMDFITPKGILGGFTIGFNNGNSFTLKQIDAPYYHIYFDLADVDGDGDIDLMYSSLNSSEGITIMKNDGAGNFTVSETFSVNTAILLFTAHDIDNDGDLDIVCGNADTKGLLTFYNGSEPDNDDNDNLPTTIINGSSLNIQIYPNPATDYINIISTDQLQEIIVYNILGEEVLKVKQKKQINVSELAPGIYNIKVTTEKGTFIQKICIE